MFNLSNSSNSTSSILKQWLPLSAAFALALGVSALTARAQDAKEPAAAKGSVAGTVTDKDGKTVEGAKVNLMKPRQRSGSGGGGSGGAAPTNPAPENPAPKSAPKSAPNSAQAHDAIELQQQRPTPIATATTDKDGKYEMKDVPVGDYMVGVRDPDKKLYGRATVKIEEGKTATADIKCSDTPPSRGGGNPGTGGTGGDAKP